MKSISTLSILISLTLFLTLTAVEPEKPTTNTNLIPKACENSTRKSLCVSVLNANPSARNADLKGLAFIALKTAANTAANTSTHIKTLLENGSLEDPELEDGYNSCAGSYVDVVDQIEDSVDALVAKNITNIDMWMSAAIADVATCDGCVKGLSAPKAKKLSEKNLFVDELCKNALDVVHVAARN